MFFNSFHKIIFYEVSKDRTGQLDVFPVTQRLWPAHTHQGAQGTGYFLFPPLSSPPILISCHPPLGCCLL